MAIRKRTLVFLDDKTHAVLQRLADLQGRGLAGVAGELLAELRPSMEALAKLFERARDSKQVAFADLSVVLADARLRSAQAESEFVAAAAKAGRRKSRAAR
jgi:hypothetical protein